MSDRYQVFRANRLWIVSDNETKETVGKPWPTQQSASEEALRLNTVAWQESKPADAPVLEWGDDIEGRLMAILDRPYLFEREYRAAA
jgi:hypothetical protein